MDLTNTSETQQLIDRILNAKHPLTLDSPELELQQVIVKAEPQQNTINQMFDRFSKGDIYFDEPTKEERIVFAKAYFEENVPPTPITPMQGQALIDAMFNRAREGNY